jgi:hypothetical protein
MIAARIIQETGESILVSLNKQSLISGKYKMCWCLLLNV